MSPGSSPQPPASSFVRLALVGANPHAKVVGLEELPGKSNYFIGNDPKQWRTNVPNFRRVRYQNVYPGIDVEFYGNQGQLEYDFVVYPGADPKAIRLAVAPVSSPAKAAAMGTSPLQLDPNGDLAIATDAGEVRFRKPVVYEKQSTVDSRQSTVANNKGPRTKDVLNSPFTIHHSQFLEGNYVLSAANELSFEVRGYDPRRTLVIDPVLVYSTYLGGSGDDYGYGIALDSAGNAYVTGQTSSSDFPTANPLQASNAGGVNVFVTKLNAAGSALVYSTYLGGSSDDYGYGIAVDSAGNAHVTGYTLSSDFPTANAFQAANHGGGDAFATKLSATGSALVYSTYLGGSSGDYGASIAVDSAGNAYVTGSTNSTNFPTAHPFQASLAGSRNAFVTVFNPTGSALVYSTYLGGSDGDVGYGVAADSAGNAYVTGYTTSANFPTANPFQASYGGGSDDAFVTKLNAAGSALVYSTYLGGSSNDLGAGIAVDSAGNAYVTGYTDSSNFPTANPFQAADAGGYDAFVTKFNAAGSALVYSTYLGGAGDDGGNGIAVDSAGNAYVTGYTNSIDFPTASPIQAALAGGYDAFVTKLNAAGSALAYSTYLGGSQQDEGFGIAVDTGGSAYITGPTNSTDYPTVNALQTNLTGVDNAFIAKISTAIGLSPDILRFGIQNLGTPSAAQVVTLTNSNPAALTISGIAFSGADAGDFDQTNDCPSSLASGASCTINVTFAPTALGSRTGTLSVTDSAPGSPHTAVLAGTGYLPPTADSVTPTPASGANQTFSLTYSVHNGRDYTDLTWVSVLINPSVVGAQGCYVRYYQPGNVLYLQNDADTGVVGQLQPVGSAGTLANSQCTVKGSGLTTISGSGATLTLNLSLSASASFLGTKNIYMMAQDSEGSSSDWQDRGTWTPIGTDTAPTADSVTPTPASGANRTFSLAFSVHNGKGYADLGWLSVLINPRVIGAQGCYALYYQPAHQLYLENDAATVALGPLTPGAAGTLANSQCTLNGTGTTASGSGATLTLKLSVSASSSFLGTKNIYMLAQDSEGTDSGWQNRGTWTPIGTDTAPTADSVTPTPASGTNQTFSLTYSAQNGKGYTDLTWVTALFNWGQSGTNGCYVRYYQPWNQLYLRNDASTADLGPLTPGSAGTVSNSQCTLNGAGSSVAGSGKSLVLNLSLSALSGFTGTKKLFMWAIDSEGTNSGWQTRGAWTP